MSTLMRIPRRYLLLATLAGLLLLSATGLLAVTRRASALTPADCAGDCRNTRDKTIEKCNELPETARDKCIERANKQYDKCLERCGE